MAQIDEQRSFAAHVLQGLHIPPTPSAVDKFIAWERQEGGHWNNTARFNPLNTTLGLPGAGNTGTQGNIKVYKSWAQGIQATIQTLSLPSYSGIRTSLHSGSSSDFENAVNSSPWGTKFAGGAVKPTGGKAIELPGQSAFEDAGKALASPFEAIGSGLSATAKLAKVIGEWLAEPMRPLKLVGGGVLLYMGLRTLTRTGVGSSVTAEARHQARSVVAVTPTATAGRAVKRLRRGGGNGG